MIIAIFAAFTAFLLLAVITNAADQKGNEEQKERNQLTL